MEFGAHIVIHSSTKYIDGQGRALGGMILCKEDFLNDHLQVFLRNTGPSISPFNAWLHLKSLETLDLRMKQHCENALKVADFLGQQKKVTRVLYPFRADHPQHNLARRRWMAAAAWSPSRSPAARRRRSAAPMRCKLIDISNNLGDAKSLMTHPETTTHQKLTPAGARGAGHHSGTCAAVGGTGGRR